jgi:squalene-hopene/tetraprenyl-beta-curcumene cyclase
MRGTYLKGYALLVAILFLLPSICLGENQPIRIVAKIKETPNLSLLNETRDVLENAHKYLLKTQLPNGSWINDPAVTSLVLYSFLLDPAYNPDTQSDAALKRGFTYLEKFVKPDGGIYDKKYKSYVTAVCLLAFSESRQDRYKTVVTNAKNFLIQFQVDEGEGIAEDHKFYGGIGYGGDDRPDLSNTQFALEAIKAAEDYEARYAAIVPGSRDQVEKEEKELGLHWKKALVFLARCQNVKSVNDMAHATDDGGFIYETGTYKEERSHSYGSMTYAGVKSLLYANVDKNDIRVKKAVAWTQDHYTWEENPGFGQKAIYYYYMTAAKCLDALGEDVIVDSSGKKHYWREELIRKLLSQHHPEGYWISEDGQYWHKVKELVTAYGIITIKYSLKGLINKS